MKHLITKSNKRAAIIEKLVGITYILAWVASNILIYNLFKN